MFQSFNTQKSIIDLFENEESIKDLVDVLFSFVLQVVKKIITSTVSFSKF
jgi:hypothetical protein